MTTDIEAVLGTDASLLDHKCAGVPQDLLHLPGPDFIDRVWTESDRSPAVLRNLGTLRNHGRLGGTGYLSIFPVDQGVEHSAAASFAPNPLYFDPDNVLRLAVEGGCNGVATTLGRAGRGVAPLCAPDPVRAQAQPQRAADRPTDLRPDHGRIGAPGLRPRRGRRRRDRLLGRGRRARASCQEVAAAFAEAHALGMVTVLWCYLRNPRFKKDGVDYHAAADLTGQANHLGVTLEADLVKQKLPETDNGFTALSFGKTSPLVQERYVSDNPIDRCRWQVLNCYAGRVGLINSGGPSAGASDLHDAVRTAVVNKRAGGSGVIAGRKVFQRPMDEGIALLHAIQDVYLDPAVTVA